MHGRRSKSLSTLVLVAVAVVLGLGGSQTMQAAERLPASNPSEVLATIEKHMSLLGLRLEKDTIQDVENRLGKTQHLEFGEGHDQALTVCFRSTRSDDPTIVEFGTDFIGGFKYLRHFLITSQARSSLPAGKCRQSTLVSKGLATPSGLRLGLSRDELITLLGPPKRTIASSLEFKFFVQIPEMIKGERSCRHLHVHIKADLDESMVRELLVSDYQESYGGECV